MINIIITKAPKEVRCINMIMLIIIRSWLNSTPNYIDEELKDNS